MGRFLLMHFPYVQNVFYHHNYTAWRGRAPLGFSRFFRAVVFGRRALIEEPLQIHAHDMQQTRCKDGF
jgi:hypothetical protein